MSLIRQWYTNPLNEVTEINDTNNRLSINVFGTPQIIEIPNGVYEIEYALNKSNLTDKLNEIFDNNFIPIRAKLGIAKDDKKVYHFVFEYEHIYKPIIGGSLLNIIGSEFEVNVPLLSTNNTDDTIEFDVELDENIEEVEITRNPMWTYTHLGNNLWSVEYLNEKTGEAYKITHSPSEEDRLKHSEQGLAPNTVYKYRIKQKDATGNIEKEAYMKFQTLREDGVLPTGQDDTNYTVNMELRNAGSGDYRMSLNEEKILLDDASSVRNLSMNDLGWICYNEFNRITLLRVVDNMLQGEIYVASPIEINDLRLSSDDDMYSFYSNGSLYLFSGLDLRPIVELKVDNYAVSKNLKHIFYHDKSDNNYYALDVLENEKYDIEFTLEKYEQWYPNILDTKLRPLGISNDGRKLLLYSTGWIDESDNQWGNGIYTIDISEETMDLEKFQRGTPDMSEERFISSPNLEYYKFTVDIATIDDQGRESYWDKDTKDIFVTSDLGHNSVVGMPVDKEFAVSHDNKKVAFIDDTKGVKTLRVQGFNEGIVNYN